jgi:hypothetical protein
MKICIYVWYVVGKVSQDEDTVITTGLYAIGYPDPKIHIDTSITMKTY